MKRINRLPRWVTRGLFLPLVALNAWVALQIFQYFQSLIAICIIATLLAFILDYPVRLLTRLKVKRTRAVLLVLLLALVFLVILGVTLIPTAINQLNELATRLPMWIESGSQQLQTLQTWAAAHKRTVDLSKLVTQLEDRLSTQLQALSGEILGFLLQAIGSVLDLVLTGVLTLYLLLYGDRVWDGIEQWLPHSLSAQVRQSLRQSFHNYFVGQATLAVLISAAMTVAFVLIQVPFGLLFGLGVGVMAMFPFGTALGICLVSFLTALKSIWLGVRVLVVATAIDQVIENVVAPQLIGGFTGLNPVWILVSLLIGAKVGGLLGLVVAVPFASFVKSMIETFKSNNL